MKRASLHRLALWAFAAVLAAGLAACDSGGSDEPKVDPLIPKQEGFYVYGTNTIAENGLSPNARMNRAILDPAQGAKVENMDGVYGKFMYIGAGGTLKFASVSGAASVVYGAAGGGTWMAGADIPNVLVEDQVGYGTLVKDAPAIKVPEEGLYYVFVNTKDLTYVIMRVEPQMIGDTTEGQWETGTPLPMKSVSATGAVFEATGLKLKGSSGYRYRFNNGWHAYATPDIVTLSSLGVPSYGEAWDSGVNNLGFFLENTPHKETGIFTVRLEYDAATGAWKETKTKTGEVAVDYTNTQMALIGSAYEGGDFNGSGNGLNIHAPAVSGKVYTWTWKNAALVAGGEFIFLEGATWGGLQIDYTGAAVGGAAIDAGQIADATTQGGQYHNFFVVTAGTYDLTLVIDAATGARTVTIKPSN